MHDGCVKLALVYLHIRRTQKAGRARENLQIQQGLNQKHCEYSTHRLVAVLNLLCKSLFV